MCSAASQFLLVLNSIYFAPNHTTLKFQIKITNSLNLKKTIMGDCRPLGFLIGLPFALIALVLSLVGAIVWIIGSVLSCLCPCCICCAGLANFAVDIIKLPIKVLRWFTYQIPC